METHKIRDNRGIEYSGRKKISRVYSDSQVIHNPRQVKSREELIPGRKYQEMFRRGETKGVVLEVLALDEPREGWFKCKVGAHEIERAMKEYGVIQYESEKWNALNYLVPVDERVRE